MQVMDEEYKKEYDAAMEKLDAEAAGTATPSRTENGQFAKAEPEAEAKAEPKQEPVTEQAPAPAVEEAKADAQSDSDRLAEALADAERAKKQAADNKAWATKVAQELADLKRDRERQEREANRPQMLAQHPELEDAIRYVADTPKAPQPDPMQEWFAVIESVHPGIFAAEADPELIEALVAKRDASGGAWYSDPLTAIRDITEGKLAHLQRQTEKRMTVSAQQASQKSAMSVPGGNGATVKSSDAAGDEVKRIQNMTPAEFERERRRVLGF